MFTFTTAGESHGRALVAIVEGLPAGVPVDVEQINDELQRRQWGYGRGGRMKIEQDRVEILSGVRHGLTLGSPLALMIENKDWANWTEVMAVEERNLEPEQSRRVKRPRPGHADLAGGLMRRPIDWASGTPWCSPGNVRLKRFTNKAFFIGPFIFWSSMIVDKFLSANGR